MADFYEAMRQRRDEAESAKRRQEAFLTNMPQGTGSLTDTPDTLRMRLSALMGNALQGAGMSGRGAARLGDKLTTMAEFVPPVGLATSADDLLRAESMDDAQLAALGLIPGLKGGSAAAREALAGVIGKGTQGVKAAEALAHGRIAQRFPTGKTATENPLTENLLINMNVLRQEPAKMKQAADIVASYPGISKQMQEMNPEEMLTAFRDQLSENYLALFDMMPPEAQMRAAKWYEGAHRISGERAREVGVPHTSSSGTYAALSPQKDWFQNVYLGDQVLRILERDPKVTTDMLRRAETIKPYTEGEAAEMLRGLEGRRIGNMDPTEQALAVRLWDETYGPRQYQKITPEGDYGDLVRTKAGEPAKPAWGSFNEIEKAIMAATSGGDPSLISPLMGEKHKVRDFYNNIIAPIEGDPFGDITADTHQIAGGLFRPLTGNSPEVMQGLHSGGKGVATAPQSAMTGMKGLYPIYADATRQAAAARDVPVRAMQSVPWEGIRSLFPKEFRTAKNQQTIDDIWRAHGRGEITADEARRRVVDVAGGFRPPSW